MVKQFAVKYKFQIIIVALIIVLYFVLRVKKDKDDKKYEQQIDESQLTKDEFYYKNFALRLKDVTEGWFDYPNSKKMAFDEWMNLADADFLKVFSEFGKIIPRGESVRSWIEGEFLGIYEPTKWKLLERFEKFGI